MVAMLVDLTKEVSKNTLAKVYQYGGYDITFVRFISTKTSTSSVIKTISIMLGPIQTWCPCLVPGMGTSLNIAFCCCPALIWAPCLGMGTSLNIAFCWSPSTHLGTVLARAPAPEVALVHRARARALHVV